MFSKALVAVDSSPAAAAVVACARELHRLGTKEAVLVQCFMIPEHVAFPDEIKSSVEKSLEPHCRHFHERGIETTIIAEPGLARIEVPRLADREGCSLVAIGSHGHSFASEIMFGGVAGELLHRVRRPLLIAPIRSETTNGEARPSVGECDFMRHVLYPTDFSEDAENAFSHVREIVGKGARKVTLLHVQEKTRLKHLEYKIDEFNIIDHERLEILRRRLVAVGGDDLEVDVVLRHGVPAAAILELQRTQGVGFVVMGTHGRGFVNEMFAGSVSHNVARHAACPVLLVPFGRS